MRTVCDYSLHAAGQGFCTVCVQKRIDKAIQEERERCAKIAEDNKAKSEDAWGAGCTYGATVIAKQIREGVWHAANV